MLFAILSRAVSFIHFIVCNVAQIVNYYSTDFPCCTRTKQAVIGTARHSYSVQTAHRNTMSLSLFPRAYITLNFIQTSPCLFIFLMEIWKTIRFDLIYRGRSRRRVRCFHSNIWIIVLYIQIYSFIVRLGTKWAELNLKSTELRSTVAVLCPLFNQWY